MVALQESGIPQNIERIAYEDCDSSDEEIAELDETNPYLNFSFMNLPNLHAISQENFVKASPRVLEENTSQSLIGSKLRRQYIPPSDSEDSESSYDNISSDSEVFYCDEEVSI